VQGDSCDLTLNVEEEVQDRSTNDIWALRIEPSSNGDNDVGDHKKDALEPMRTPVLDEVVDENDGDEQDADKETVGALVM